MNPAYWLAASKPQAADRAIVVSVPVVDATVSQCSPTAPHGGQVIPHHRLAGLLDILSRKWAPPAH
jgi:hypothetical protein